MALKNLKTADLIIPSCKYDFPKLDWIFLDWHPDTEELVRNTRIPFVEVLSGRGKDR
jgi:hypothetical protein